MLSRIAALAVLATTIAACSGNPTAPGGLSARDALPSLDAGGTPNPEACHGQSVSTAAQQGEGGFAGFAEAHKLTVQEAQDKVEGLVKIPIKCPKKPAEAEELASN